jgi:hypothetical protein
LYSKLWFLSNRKYTASPSQNKPVNAVYGNIVVYEAYKIHKYNVWQDAEFLMFKHVSYIG